MKIKKWSILLILVLFLTGCGSKMESSLDEANSLAVEGKFEEAEKIYLELIEEYSRRSEPHLKLGQLYLMKSDYDKAEEHLVNIKDESGELATSLIQLAGDSNNEDLLNKTFKEYKEKDFIEEDHSFFENAILAYGKFNDLEKIEEGINRVEELNLKLNPYPIEKAYTSLRNEGREDLAKVIIEKDIYNKEIADLSLIPKIIEEENREFVNLTSGYFINKDRLDIAILYGIGYDGYFPELEIVLVNGISGEIISTYKEESINAHMNIGSLDTSGRGNHILYLWGHAGGSGTPATIDLYRINNNEFEEIDYEVESDREITFKDNFEYEVASEKLGINYLMQLDLGQVPYYISEGIYSQEGKLLVAQEEIGSGYEGFYVENNLAREDLILSSLGLWDSYDNKSFLGQVESYFKLEENNLVFVDLLVKNELGKPRPYDYKKVKGYKEIDFSNRQANEENLEEFLSYYLDLFEETENAIRSEYGKPIVEGSYGVKYLKYDDFVAFVNHLNPNEPITSIWTNNILGIENSVKAIIRMFGAPDDSGYDIIEEDRYIDYYLEDYYVSFINIGEEIPYIKIKPR